MALQFHAAIEVYTRGLAIAPEDVRLLRFRGHRYISTRRFDLARRICAGRSALRLELRRVYHLGLAHYLSGEFDEAARVYRSCLDTNADPRAAAARVAQLREPMAGNDRVAVSDWLYRALRRAGRHDEAKALLPAFTPDMKVGENEAYFTALRFYGGAVTEEAAMTPVTKNENRLVTVGYGVATFYLANADTPARARC